MTSLEYFTAVVQHVHLRPEDALAQRFARHRDQVEGRLNAKFQLSGIKRIGSFSRGTAIRSSSDLDLLAVIRREDVTRGGKVVSSQTVMLNVRDGLKERFPSSDIGRDGQAVVVDFAQGRETVDVVPAYYQGPGLGNYPVYRIPDGRGGWMETSPELHNKFIADADKASGFKLKNVVRLMKAWGQSRAAAGELTSLHLELLLASQGTCLGVKSYSSCLRDTFQLLSSRECRALQDPQHWAGLIPAAGTESKRVALLGSVRTSLRYANNALVAEQAGRPREAVEQWKKVLSG